MHHQRIAAFLLGALILGSLFMIFVATQNFGMADRLGDPQTHAALRDMAGRLNQLFFVNWERAELILGIALLGLVAFGMRSRMLSAIAGAVVDPGGGPAFFGHAADDRDHARERVRATSRSCTRPTGSWKW